jgi:hypothetical protein
MGGVADNTTLPVTVWGHFISGSDTAEVGSALDAPASRPIGDHLEQGLGRRAHWLCMVEVDIHGCLDATQVAVAACPADRNRNAATISMTPNTSSQNPSTIARVASEIAG